jgi:hypothetical protein
MAGLINYCFPFDRVKITIITRPAHGAWQSWQPTGRKKAGRPKAALCLLEFYRHRARCGAALGESSGNSGRPWRGLCADARADPADSWCARRWTASTDQHCPLPDQSTTLWVDPSSTGDTRRRGALNRAGCHRHRRRWSVPRTRGDEPCHQPNSTANIAGSRTGAELGRNPGGNVSIDAGEGWSVGGVRSAVGCRGSRVKAVDLGEDWKRHTQGGCIVELPAARVQKHGLISID